MISCVAFLHLVYYTIMPELPEVEIITMGMKDFLVGHKIRKAETDWSKSFRISHNQLNNQVLDSCITGLRRIGKMILIDLSSQTTLVIHLKLTGQLVYRRIMISEEIRNFGGGHPSASLVAKLPDKTTRVIFTLDKQAKLFFNDMRKFGWIKLLSTGLVKQTDFISKLGPDALTIGEKEFIHRLNQRRKCIKACLLDQSIIAGCGNIYADESLCLSGIHPQIPASHLKTRQLKILREKLQHVLKLSIEKGGSSSRNYVNASGERGRYLDFAYAYQRTGLPCRRCSNTIKRTVVAGRGTHYCAVCQKEEAS